MRNGEKCNYSPKDYKFDPEGYNVDNEFERILREAGVKMTDNDKKIGDKKFNPPTISSEPFSSPNDDLNIPNFNKKPSDLDINSSESTFKIPDLPNKTKSNHSQMPNFAKKASTEAQDDYYERKDTNEHEKNIEDRQFGQRIEEVHDFTQKFNRAMKIHLRNTNREISDKLSEEAKELSEKAKSAISSISERLGGKKEDFKKVGKNALAVTLALTTVAGIGVASRQLKKGGTTVEETTLGYEGDAIIHGKELQDEVGIEEKTDADGSEIRVNSDTGEAYILVESEKNKSGNISPDDSELAGKPISEANTLKVETKDEDIDESRNNKQPVGHVDSFNQNKNEAVANFENKADAEEANTKSGEDTNKESEKNENSIPSSRIVDDIHAELKLTDSMKSQIERIKKVYKEHYDTYKQISDQVKKDKNIFVPPELICAIHSREKDFSGQDIFDVYLHNGQRLGETTTQVPKGVFFEKGKFVEAGIDAIEMELDGWNYKGGVTMDSMSEIAKFAKRYNGGKSYVWSGTTNYEKGMSPSDNNYNPNMVDQRVGVVAIIMGLLEAEKIN